MVEDDDVKLVESIGGIDGTPPTLDVQSVHMYGSIGASFIVATSNHVDVVAISNFVIVALYSIQFQKQQLATIQVQAITCKSHSGTSPCWGFFCCK